MEQLEVKQISLVQLSELQKISRLTFADTFGAANTETDLKKYLDEAYSNQKLTKELNNPETFFYFGYIDHQLAGYLKLNVGKAQSDKVSNNSLEVERIYILPAFKRHGLGKKLIEVAESIAKQKHKDNLWLGVWEGNPKAIAFYQAQGFERIGQHTFVVGDDPQTDYLMEKSIK
ncbi:GNAT family N-acetyltransferase [Fructilactobacillus lindneri]|uniref:N-acetyltransferase n=2 Tax=Fructilactobacillus lindneri TaxID=53444 RepID=A0A0R2JR22_9LACO|nr:GNAT family N-acetyltransferase [Fructilactobacillus lindneri]ANZ57607.1 acetyltransferase [Fructilactobacillus lindneri]ANZ58877.1 acetyltransferase [Fructilactobacillus lindneri]KRN79563.1 N-acetyltransferase [Fructilactobacillus lindneri DSM 20690 = JCM 11027]POG97758.1 GNAT family N-acetyltransferase [Fructilactobacillus lindneri]POH00016.1 GNAT family N-acetyltransferase [Fructilactobacillus lindneri]